MSYKELPDPKEGPDGIWFVEYDVFNTDGKKIGTTRLTGKTEREVWKKVQASHAEATAAIERLRKKRTPIYKPGSITPDEDATRKAQEAEAAANAERQHLMGERISLNFMRNHIRDYWPCEANSKLMADFLTSHQLTWCEENLEIAFQALDAEGKICPPNKEVLEEYDQRMNAEPKPPVVAPPETPPPPPPEEKFPWGSRLTAERVQSMAQEEMQHWLYASRNPDPALRAEFSAQLVASGYRRERF